MFVHLGVILLAVAIAASNSYTHSATLELSQGDEVEWAGHTFELVEVVDELDERVDVARANILVDRSKVYGPAVTTYLLQGMVVPTPSVRTGFANDIYLTIDGTNPPAAGSSEVTLRVFIKPLILWMWVGGAIMAIGTVLSAVPSARHRRPTDATSAPVSEASRAD
jgi:cytochrome c-type biogenesis protein CcmF